METLTVHAPSPSTNLPSYGNGAFSLSAPHVPGAGPLLVQVVYSFFEIFSIHAIDTPAGAYIFFSCSFAAQSAHRPYKTVFV